MNLPADLANQVLDSCGWPISPGIGDLQEGSREAQIILRWYGQCMRQMLRAANWDWARVQVDLQLLADASGNTPNVGTIVPQPWTYSYAYPSDCMKVRYVPYNWPGTAAAVPTGNIVPPNNGAPIVGGLQPWMGGKLRPSRFLIGIDKNNPPPAGSNDWTIQGVSPQGRTAIFSNVKNAQVIYTALINYPSMFDSLFREALVAYIASEVALPLWALRDKAFGAKIRAENIAIAKEKILQARATNGNESGWNNSDFQPDWMRFRRAEGPGWGGSDSYGGGGAGYFWGGYDDCCGAGNTSAY